MDGVLTHAAKVSLGEQAPRDVSTACRGWQGAHSSDGLGVPCSVRPCRVRQGRHALHRGRAATSSYGVMVMAGNIGESYAALLGCPWRLGLPGQQLWDGPTSSSALTLRWRSRLNNS